MVNQTTFTNDMSTLILMLFVTFHVIAIIGLILAYRLLDLESKFLQRNFVIGLIIGGQVFAIVLVVVWKFTTYL